MATGTAWRAWYEANRERYNAYQREYARAHRPERVLLLAGGTDGTLANLAEIGAVILPPIPAMYAKPQSVDDIINHTVGKSLDQLGIENDLFNRWK